MTTSSPSAARTGVTVLLATASGASVGIALVEAALVLDFALAPWAWVLVGGLAWATALALYRVLDGVLNGGPLGPC